MITKNKITRDLETLYLKINSAGKDAIRNRQEKIDPILNILEQDKRFGLTLLFRIKGKITINFRILMEEIQKIERSQYFYPISDLHVTVLDLVSANEDFKRDELLITESIKLVENAVANISPFSINFKGIITSNAAVLAKGYYNDGLQKLRDQIRRIAVKQGFDLKERYQSISAHSTIARFKSNIQNSENLLAIIQKYTDFNIGEFNVNELELVIHDWYDRRKFEVERFFLKNL